MRGEFEGKIGERESVSVGEYPGVAVGETLGVADGHPEAPPGVGNSLTSAQSMGNHQ